MKSLAGKRIVITGGASGIGLAVAHLAARLDADEIVLVSRSKEKLQAAKQNIAKSMVRAVDVTDEDAVASLFANLRPFDHLVTAAAGTYRGKITELETTSARALFESKFWGQHHCVKHGASQIRNGGSVTLFSGWISRKPAVGTGTLAAIDGAIESLTRVLSLELAPIRVNAVSPGQIDTPLWSARLSAEQQRQHFASVAAQLPVERVATAEDVAEGVMFLMTNQFTTGAILDTDGGQPWGKHG
jgi:NAD(P)-dependent dehydrogenase (short-subunit alcohol dehydrogenase family)